MIVTEEIDHPELPNHKIQFGISTWTQDYLPQDQTESVRRAVYNENGVFSPHGSSEVPMEDMLLLVDECVKRRKIKRWDILKLLIRSLIS